MKFFWESLDYEMVVNITLMLCVLSAQKFPLGKAEKKCCSVATHLYHVRQHVISKAQRKEISSTRVARQFRFLQLYP